MQAKKNKKKMKFEYLYISGPNYNRALDEDELPRTITVLLAHFLFTKGRGNSLTEEFKTFCLSNERTKQYVPAAGKQMRMFSHYFAFKFYLEMCKDAHWFKLNQKKPEWLTEKYKKFPRYISATTLGKIERVRWLKWLKEMPDKELEKYTNTRCLYVLKKAFYL